MADLSFSFNPTQIASAYSAASAGSVALSKIAAKSATWDKGSAASSLAVLASSKASTASVAAAGVSNAASDALSKATGASTALSDAISKANAAMSKASTASVAAAGVSNAASDALSKATTASQGLASAASDATVAKAKANSLASTVVRSVPGVNSRAVHEIIVTSAGLIKYVYSSVAQA